MEESEVIVLDAEVIPAEARAELVSLEAPTAANIQSAFVSYFSIIEKYRKLDEAIQVDSVDDVDGMKMAREARLALAKNRTAADKKRKELKEDSIKYGKAVQGVYNIIEYVSSQVELSLDKKEKFAEYAEKKRIEELVLERKADIYGMDGYILPSDMAETVIKTYTTEQWLSYVETLKSRKAAEETRLKAERIASERKVEIAQYKKFLTAQEVADINSIGYMPDAVYSAFVSFLKDRELAYEKEREDLRVKNEEARKIAEATAEKAKKEAEEIRKKAEADALKAKKAKEAADAKAKAEADEMRKKFEEERRVADEKANKEAEDARKKLEEAQKKAAEESEKAKVAAENSRKALEDEAKKRVSDSAGKVIIDKATFVEVVSDFLYSEAGINKLLGIDLANNLLSKLEAK